MVRRFNIPDASLFCVRPDCRAARSIKTLIASDLAESEKLYSGYERIAEKMMRNADPALNDAALFARSGHLGDQTYPWHRDLYRFVRQSPSV
jgi:hypothetical protein